MNKLAHTKGKKVHFAEERVLVQVSLFAATLFPKSTIIVTKVASLSFSKGASLKANRSVMEVSKATRSSSTLAESLAYLSASKQAILKGAVGPVGR